MEPEQTNEFFYGGLNPASVSGVLSPHMRGADEDLLRDFLAEAELDVQNEIGTLPGNGSDQYDRIVRAVIRDLAGGRAILKLVGTDNDEGRRAGEALIEYAWNRLLRWTDARNSGADDPSDAMVHNIFPHPLYNDPTVPPGRRYGSEWPGM